MKKRKLGIPVRPVGSRLPQSDNPGPSVEVVRPAFLELFAGKAGLTQQVRELGLLVLEPRDLRGDGTDLSNDTVLREIIGLIRGGQVRWLHLAPPCRTFSRARRTDRFGAVQPLRSSQFPGGIPPISEEVLEANHLMKTAARLSKACIRAGAWFSVENPARSFAWSFGPMAALSALPGVFSYVGAQCRFGCEYRKETRWLTNATWLSFLEGSCPGPPEHPAHETLEGTKIINGQKVWRTALAAEYPIELCKVLAKSYKEALTLHPSLSPPDISIDLRGSKTQ